ncbi:MAG: ATPase domain-containing protein, partial [Chromatocurvus sp.]
LNMIRTGEFDIAGLLAVLEHKAVRLGATVVAFDALDQLLQLADDDRVRMREVTRLQEWVRQRGLTALISAKCHESGEVTNTRQGTEYLQFMLDCVVTLEHRVVDGISQRSLRIRKYRGTGFEENALPFIIGHGGLDVASVVRYEGDAAKAAAERITSGVPDLDTMLQGGFFRASSVLVTGAPGTAKTTLCGAFARAACERGEKTLFVSYDSQGDEIVRNLLSVGIDLQPHIDSGTLSMVSMRALQGSAESQLIAIRRLAEDMRARVLITDPLSALSKSGNAPLAPSVTERLVDWAKNCGITVMCSSLLDAAHDLNEGTPLQISTIADTWLHLTYVVYAGERNRGLSIIKSRGTAHSNQVRELRLSAAGVQLEEVYSASGEVLMGAMRWERERKEALEARESESAAERERLRLNSEAAELEAQMALMESRLAAKRREVENAREDAGARVEESERRQEELRDLRLGGRGSKGIEARE